jgi:hypothetical protein
MADATDVHLDVRLELGGDTITGTVDDGAGPAVKSTGWLDLMSAFDAASARARGTAQGADSGVVARDRLVRARPPPLAGGGGR